MKGSRRYRRRGPRSTAICRPVDATAPCKTPPVRRRDRSRARRYGTTRCAPISRARPGPAWGSRPPPPMMAGNSQLAIDPATGTKVPLWGLGMTAASGLCYQITGVGGTAIVAITDRCGGYCECGSGFNECGDCINRDGTPRPSAPASPDGPPALHRVLREHLRRDRDVRLVREQQPPAFRHGQCDVRPRVRERGAPGRGKAVQLMPGPDGPVTAIPAVPNWPN